MNADLKTKKVMKSTSNHRKKGRVFFEGAEIIRYHRYSIEYKKGWHEIVCPRYTFADGNYVIVIPWYLIPGRPYPVQVYLHACSVYSTTPEQGQRGAASATRKEFNLKKFSYSTVSRSFRDLETRREQELKRRFGEELKVCGEVNTSLIGSAEKGKFKSREEPNIAGRFPTISDTGSRRKEMAAFLRGFIDTGKKVNIEAAAHQFVENWNKKMRRLLL